MQLAGDEWNACFDTMQREAWRLETLPDYTMPQEAEKLSRFMAGEKSPDDYTSGWMDEVRQWRSEGKSVGRVHIVTRPLSDYLRFEFEYYYRHHVKAGEKIRILDVTDRDNPLAGVGDFWKFDSTKVVLMHYEQDGTQINRATVKRPYPSGVRYCSQVQQPPSDSGQITERFRSFTLRTSIASA